MILLKLIAAGLISWLVLIAVWSWAARHTEDNHP